TRARVEGRLDRGRRVQAGVVDQTSRDPVFAADAQKPAPGAEEVAAAGGPGFRREQADGDDIDRAVYGFKQALNIQDRAAVRTDERQPEPNEQLGRPRSHSPAQVMRL